MTEPEDEQVTMFADLPGQEAARLLARQEAAKLQAAVDAKAAKIAAGYSPHAMSLAEALAQGQGIERPFRCHKHDDHHASASVNVVKGVWCCYTCNARGRVEGRAEPKDDELRAMLHQGVVARVYPASWLTWFGAGYYWLNRFPMWACKMFNLGQDPITGDATFPVYAGTGPLAGVGRRNDAGPARYMYPFGWSAAQSLGCHRQARAHGAITQTGIVVLTEGFADAVACWEAGIPALCVYGSGLHWPQRELIATQAPKLIVHGFDADEAGHRAALNSDEIVNDIAETVTCDWSTQGAKDPADLSVEARVAVVASAVSTAMYRPNVDVELIWSNAAASYARQFA